MNFNKIELKLLKILVKKKLSKNINCKSDLLDSIDFIVKTQEITDSKELKLIYELKDYINDFGKENTE